MLYCEESKVVLRCKLTFYGNAGIVSCNGAQTNSANFVHETGKYVNKLPKVLEITENICVCWRAKMSGNSERGWVILCLRKHFMFSTLLNVAVETFRVARKVCNCTDGFSTYFTNLKQWQAKLQRQLHQNFEIRSQLFTESYVLACGFKEQAGSRGLLTWGHLFHWKICSPEQRVTVLALLICIQGIIPWIQIRLNTEGIIPWIQIVI